MYIKTDGLWPNPEYGELETILNLSNELRPLLCGQLLRDSSQWQNHEQTWIWNRKRSNESPIKAECYFPQDINR